MALCNRLVAFSCALVLAGTAVASPPTYEFVPLNQAGISYSRAWEINDLRQVALEAGTGVGGTIGFRWASGVFQPLPTIVPSGSNARATVRSINNLGFIVGNSYGPGGLLDQRGVRWAPDNSLTDLGRYNNSNTFFDDINEAGVIVGDSNRAFRYEPGTGYVELAALSGSTSANASAINENDWVAGSSSAEISPGLNQTRGTVWKPDGTLINLGILDIPGQDDTTSVAFGVNDNNEVVGYFGNPTAFSHAFYWNEVSGIVDLGAPGGRSSFANDINNSGDIVGYASFATGPLQRAYLWRGGVAYDLNQFLPPGSGWQLNEAYGINELGDIVGRGTLGGQTQAFLLRIPEPATGMLLAMAGALILIRRW
jgi:probable HAF family extracellular repeat protein